MAIPFSAYPQGNIRLGPMEVHPGISVQGRYDDNIFLNQTNKESDFITTVTPFLALRLPFMQKKHSLDFAYRADMVSYNKNTTENTTNQEFTGSLRMNFPGGLDLNLNALRLDTSEPSNSAEQSDIAARIPRTQNQLNASARYRISTRFDVGLAQRIVRHNYKSFDLNSEDREERDTTLSVYYKFLPKTSAFAEAGFGQIAYLTPRSPELDRSSSYTAVRAGLSWDPASRLSGTLKAGLENRDFSAENKQGLTNFTIGGDLKYQLTSKISTKLTLEKGFRETNIEEERTKPVIEYTMALLSLEHRFSSKVSFLLSGIYENDSYPTDLPDSREDNYYGIDFAIQYRIRKWWEMGTSYTFRTRNSTLPASEFSNKVISAYSRWVF